LSPGRAGGVSLAVQPHSIRLGEVVRHSEPNLRLAECFDPETNTCGIAPICTLKPVLNRALTAFLESLNGTTLADLLANGGEEKIATAFVMINRRAATPP
jgi:Rrf2 family nitric oxide-sensitive transcriptional repressor